MARRGLAILLAAGFAGPAVLHAQSDPARDLAQKVLVTAETGPVFRYNQGTDPYDPSTVTLFDRPSAFVPGEKVRLSFRLPRDTRFEKAAEVRATFGLYDVDGKKLQDAGEVAVRAEAGAVQGALEWTVPEAREGSYFLAARFLGREGKTLASRSEVVFVAPDYPRLLAEARAVRIDSASLPPLLRDVSLPSTQLLSEDAESRFRDFGRAPRDWDYVKQKLTTARDYALQLAEGKDPFQDRTGLLIKGYRSEVDDTLQPYALYVPKTYDPKRRWPLLVSLHGAFSSHVLNRRRTFGLGNRLGESDYEAVRNEDVPFPDVDFIVLSPYGRGETAGYNGLGEADVLRAIDDVERAYNVDADRVYLTGYSMGGGGTWHLGLRYPDRFAAIVPVCAVADATLFPSAASLSADDKALLDLVGAGAIAENASNQQVFIFHGDADPVVVPEHSRRMVARYRELGWLDRTVHYFELPGVHHFAWDFAYRDASIFPRLAPVRRNPSPDRVVYSTHSPRFNKAYWLRVDRIDRGFRLARIEGARRDGGFDVKTDNLSAFTILLDAARVEAGRPLEVTVDGSVPWRGAARGSRLSLARDRAGRWKEKPWTGPAVGPPDHPEAGVVGATLAQTGAHVYVYGTGGDAATNEALRQGAERLADWGPDVRARFPVVADTAVTPETIASRDLVLVGDADVNKVVARIADKLPIRKRPDGTFAGGRRVASSAAAYRIVYPNPLSPGRYVLVYGASTPDALGRVVAGPGPGLRFTVPPDYRIFGDDGTPVLEGYFKDAWTIEVPAKRP
jgi:dienelactone hydrolase